MKKAVIHGPRNSVHRRQITDHRKPPLEDPRYLIWRGDTGDSNGEYNQCFADEAVARENVENIGNNAQWVVFVYRDETGRCVVEVLRGDINSSCDEVRLAISKVLGVEAQSISLPETS